MNRIEQVSMTALKLTELSRVYGEHAAVDGVSLSVNVGESLAVIGHNGAGKTTLMKLILGLTRPSAGSIARWSYRSGSPQPQTCSESIGFLPESVAFPGTLTGRQMLRFYARLKHVNYGQCEQMLDLVGLVDAAGNKISTYSKGMRQRLGLAQALLGSPDLLLLDEPTSGLDPFLKQHFYRIIADRQAAGATVIISSHALTEIEARTDHIAIMKSGRLLEQGSLNNLRHKAALPVRVVVRHKSGCGDSLLAQISVEVSVTARNAQQLELACGEKHKLTLLHELTSQRDIITDVIARPPQLDELYAHFVNAGDT